MNWENIRRRQLRVADVLPKVISEQLHSTWLGSSVNGGGNEASGVAPLHDELAGGPADWAELNRDGLGQLTRSFGTVPVTARDGAKALARTQREIAAASRFGIPAIAHDECLAGFTAWTAAIFPVPLAWGASFDPELVRQMALQIGTSMGCRGPDRQNLIVIRILRGLHPRTVMPAGACAGCIFR